MDYIKISTLIERCLQKSDFLAGSIKTLLAIIFVSCGASFALAQGSGYNTDSINVTALSFSPPSVDTTSSDSQTTVTVRITDSERDFMHGDIYLRRPPFANFPNGINHGFEIAVSNRISGDGRDGVYRIQININRFAQAGQWNVSFFIYDGTPSYYRWRAPDTAYLAARGLPTYLKVINDNEASAPVISEFNLTPSVSRIINGARTATITARIKDVGSGFARASIRIKNPPNCAYYDDECSGQSFEITPADRIAGDEFDGVYRRIADVSGYAPGRYYVTVASYDAVLNQSYVSSDDLITMGSQGIFYSVATPFDLDGDGRSDLSVFRPSDRTWYLDRSALGFSAIPFGLASDQIAPADFDGDGWSDICVYRGGTWYYLSSNYGTISAYQFGTTGDIPIPADYTGDGKADPAVYRNGEWWIKNGVSGTVEVVKFGLATDGPLPADYDGDGRVDIAVYRPSDGTWYELRSLQGFAAVPFGIATDIAVPADYDGDGKADPAVYRGGIWYMLQSSHGFSAVSFGVGSDVPTPGDYDGDGRSDVGVFRPSNGTWYAERSTIGTTTVHFGSPGDKPLENAYVH